MMITRGEVCGGKGETGMKIKEYTYHDEKNKANMKENQLDKSM